MSEEARMQVVEYRLDKVEELLGQNIAQINNKLDTIIEANSDFQAAIATQTARAEAIQYQVSELKVRVDDNAKDIGNMRVSLAEKVGPGALAGAISAILIVAGKALLGI